jgi:hypothetical protein
MFVGEVETDRAMVAELLLGASGLLAVAVVLAAVSAMAWGTTRPADVGALVPKAPPEDGP